MKFSALNIILGLAIIGLAKTAEHCSSDDDSACYGIQAVEQIGSYRRVARAAAYYGYGDATTTLSTSASSNPTATAAAAASGTSGGDSDDDGDSYGNSGGASDGDGDADEYLIVGTASRAIKAHGTIMAFTFVIVFPLGALLIRLASFKGLVWVHAAIQGFGYLSAFTGLGLGIYIAMNPVFKLNYYHPIIGIVVISLLAFQPVIGLLHHRLYKTSSNPTGWSTMHVWLGRLVITLGIINGGLGLRFAADTTNGEIIYGVFAGLVWLVYVGVTVWKTVGKKAHAN